MKKHLLAMICATAVALPTLTSCESETEYVWDEASRISAYVNWVDGTICRQVVDNLDYLFQASAYRDSLLCGGGTEAVIKRQFSNPHIKPPHFDDNGEICCFESIALHTIIHNGISLEEDGAVWSAYGRMERFWEATQQPIEEYCQWTVSRENGVYTLSGGMIHNGLWQEFFTMSNFLGLNFTTSIAEVNITTDFDNNIHEVKQTLRYCFDGILMAVGAGRVDDDNEPRPEVSVLLEGVTGHNSKEYIEGIPVHGAPYFNEGTLSAVFSNDWKVVIDYTQGGYNYAKLE